MDKQHQRLPGWLKTRVHTGREYSRVQDLLKNSGLNTICIESRCPNKAECFSKKEVTFLIAGDTCTRNCRYCNVENITNRPNNLDENEPGKIASAVYTLGINYVVITSVTRDDLEDGGAIHFSNTVKAILEKNPQSKIELLIPDFKGDLSVLDKLCSSGATVIGHNIEIAGTELFKKLRPEADYKTSLRVLEKIASRMKYCKSGFMVGFGESFEDIEGTLIRLKNSGVNLVTIGQYLAPSKKHVEVKHFYNPAEFKRIRKIAGKLGFIDVKAGPFVRSSYKAGDIFE